MGRYNPHAGYGYLLPGTKHDLEHGDDDTPHEADDVTCKHCGAGPFTWVHTGERWRLVGERGKFHTCAPKATADDFNVLTP